MMLLDPGVAGNVGEPFTASIPGHELHDPGVRSLIGERLTVEAFTQLSGNLAGYPFVKVVVDRGDATVPVVHFLNHARYQFHSDYIGENILHVPIPELERKIDEFNRSVYLSPDRRFFLGILSLHSAQAQTASSRADRFFALETVEIDNMDAAMVRFFYDFLNNWLDPSVPLFFKPANHLQEKIATQIDPTLLPRVFSHELFNTARFIALNTGTGRGRLRPFRTIEEYQSAVSTLEWYDIIVMHRVPDDIPRVSGIINAHHTTPLSHTNVLASGWRIPNSIQIGIFDLIDRERLAGQWVEYAVDSGATEVKLTRIERPLEANSRPAWTVQRIDLEQPETVNTPILSLDALRMSDRYRYGTKAANLGELRNLLENGSERMLGFYKIRRPPRPNLLPHLAQFLGIPAEDPRASNASDVGPAAWKFLRGAIQIPRGIALPFSV
ncbi:MAG: PEP/pyruvate-binding domain-containing protein, partial [Bdellovibrionota bacterium]